ncbi:hypothetical protein HHK36_002339 [Tetracentron sinense]|uniref:WRKY domain-containing protein n=1 Tax=Tetracentron sinense TaxID=13715 RepID=A0A834ZZP9_TETSI|nr:hypothetical protein HHK36_002339 [Tetracentron sinense]
MAGVDDHVALIGDWAPPNPSPRTFFSSILGDDFGSSSFSELLGNEGPFAPSEKQMNCDEEDVAPDGVSDDRFSESSTFSAHISSSRGGLAERMAARTGFNSLRLNTATIRSPNISSSPQVRSSYLTIPPGLSPTTLLDSPVFLSNSLAQPSPTTGKFPLDLKCSSRSSMLISEAPDRSKDNLVEDVNTSSFAFKPIMESRSSFFPGAANKVIGVPFGILNWTSYISIYTSREKNIEERENSFIFLSTNIHLLQQVTPANNPHQSLPSIEVSVRSEMCFQSRSLEPPYLHSQNRNGLHSEADFSKSFIEKEPSGYNPMPDPSFSDIVVDNAELSPPLDDKLDEEGDQKSRGGEVNSVVGNGAPSEDGYNWRKYGQKQVKGSEYPRSYYKCTNPNCQVKKKVERSHEGHITEIIYKGAHNHSKPPPNRRSAVGSFGIPEQVGAQAVADGDPVWASTQRGTVGGGPDWKHDNLEVTSSASAAPKFCDPSTSLQAQDGPHFESSDAVDFSSTLSNNEDEDEDDRETPGSVSLGYDGDGDESESKRRKTDACTMEMSGATRAIREPRVVVQTTSEVDILDDGSYYKCTNAGCTVRKHVERASHDLKSVITTYEGKHNHDVPAARNSSHVNAGTSSTAHAQSAQNNVHRPEPTQFHNTSLGSFSLHGTQHLGSSPGFSFGMNQAGLANVAMAGLGPVQAKLPVLSPYLGQQQQQRRVNELGFMMPKEEPMLEAGMNLSNGSSVYHQIMSMLPLGPQL